MPTESELRAQIAELQQQLEALKGPRIMALCALFNEVTRALREEANDRLPKPVQDLAQQAYPRLALIRKQYDMSETQQSNVEKKVAEIIDNL